MLLPSQSGFGLSKGPDEVSAYVHSSAAPKHRDVIGVVAFERNAVDDQQASFSGLHPESKAIRVESVVTRVHVAGRISASPNQIRNVDPAFGWLGDVIDEGQAPIVPGHLPQQIVETY